MIVKIQQTNRSTNFGVKDPKTNKPKAKYDNCHDKWVPGTSRITGVINTGLTESEERKFEKELSLKEGTLSKGSTFWDNYTIIIPEEGLVLNTEIPDHNLKYKLLLADPYVVQGEENLKRKANAEYVMTSEEGKAKSENTKRNVIAKAYAIFAKMTKVEISDALYMFGKDSENLDPEIAQNRLGEIVDDNPGKFLEIVGDSQFKDKVWFMKLIKAGIVKKHGTGKGTNMPLYFEDIMLGNGLAEAIAFVKDKENQAILLGLKKSLDVK